MTNIPNTTNTTTQPTQPTLPSRPSHFPLDSTNPLVWIIVLTALLGTIEKPLNAVAKVIRAIAALLDER
ncbi:MAG: hypothetical protein MUF49_14185 [Oculatellaceae cyanobacterium Prado106]|nr:hypothetical protein [Oculatellaceae cyanobacterium Prado106]